MQMNTVYNNTSVDVFSTVKLDEYKLSTSGTSVLDTLYQIQHLEFLCHPVLNLVETRFGFRY